MVCNLAEIQETQRKKLPTCYNSFGWAVCANTSIPGRRDCQVVLCSTVQGGEVAAAAAHTTAVVLPSSSVDGCHCVQHVQQGLVPGDRDDASVAAYSRNEGV